MVVAFDFVGSLLALGGADALAGLDEVAFDGFGARGKYLEAFVKDKPSQLE